MRGEEGGGVCVDIMDQWVRVRRREGVRRRRWVREGGRGMYGEEVEGELVDVRWRW